MNSIQALIADLRDAATNENWGKCREVTLALFNQMPLESIARITLRNLEGYASSFLVNHPEESWVRDRLDEMKLTLNDINTKKWDETLPDFDKHYETAGDNNFVSSIAEFWRMFMHWDEPSRAKKLARDAISNSIMAASLQKWGQENQELWERMKNPTTDSDRIILSTHFKSDRDVLNIQFEAWLSLADEIDKWSNEEMIDT